MSTAHPRELGRAFEDADVARNYRHRQPYPAEIFEILERLLVEPRTVLDAGCGTGALTIGLAKFAERVDGIDPSAAMLREARRMPGANNKRIRWIQGTAEEAPLDPPYGLVTAGVSIHWMEPDIVMPRFGAALAPGGRLAIVDMDSTYGEQKWRGEFLELVRAFSPIPHHLEKTERVRVLEASGHFVREGASGAQQSTVEQSVDDYMAMLASTSTLSRTTLGAQADEFDRRARDIFARHGMTSIRADVVSGVTWGRPR
ncbi:MAG TPA: class I SAM-dependent methyltransferase [Candidatus Limnocylindria bacterium]|jgi:ubiquinone/menaquinone biosynthesis C-methylase UbiE